MELFRSARTGWTDLMPTTYHETALGRIVHGDALDVLKNEIRDESVNLIVTSPPFALLREKDYGNAHQDHYLDWFRPFGELFHRALCDDGSLVIDIGGSWKPGLPTRSLYHFKLLIMLVEEMGFHLAQEFFWWNPAKLPTPAEWVNVRRIRVKDAVNCVWWLSKSPWPRADNRRVLQPYSRAMRDLLQNGYTPKKRPSGHDISANFSIDNGGAIPPNLLAIPNTESNGQYQRYCKENGIRPHPARFPVDLPEYFVRLLTDRGDTVVDPFAGSCVTGEVAERLGRRWVCVDLEEEYLAGAMGRFLGEPETPTSRGVAETYSIARPGSLWRKNTTGRLRRDGGRSRIEPPPRH